MRGVALHVKTAGAGAALVQGVRGLFAPRAVASGAGAVAQSAAPAAAAAGNGFRAGLAEFKAGLQTGRRFGAGAEQAAAAAPSLWRSVGHNVADQAVGGAVMGTVLGGAMGAYQAPKGEGFSGALAGAGSGLKAGIVGGALAGGAGGAMRHARFKAITKAGMPPADAMKIMSKSPLQNAKDAWANRGTEGAWQADALEAAAVPVTLVAENAAQGLGEMKQEKKADACSGVVHAVRAKRLAKLAALPEGDPQRPLPQVVVVPVMRGKEKTPEQLAVEKRQRDQLENDQAIGRAVGPLTGTIGAEALLRMTVDPHVRKNPTGALSMLTPDSVPRKILLPGLGAALGAYGAHKLIQSRREYREMQEREELEREIARRAQAASAPGAPPAPVTSSLGTALMRASNG